MIDPMTSLAFNVYANKGSYALLLGSGVSRSAGIPTGWGIVLDLISQIAQRLGEAPLPDPETWFRTKYNAPPHYSRLLEQLAQTRSERQQLLRRYFEPNEEERAQGRKQPTPAHRAIADLVAAGYVRVIVTTNFDRLLEMSLGERGITPTVISTPDAVTGALPLSHLPTRCQILKLHGDYLDVRILNTPTELDRYPPPFRRLLDRIFDEFGLVVCGWSAEYDTALRATLERCQAHRFTTYWTSVMEPTDTAKQLIQLRRAVLLTIEGADPFFQELADSVLALEQSDRRHPLTAPIAVDRLKQYLEDERREIRLHDLLTGETETVYGRLSDEATRPVASASDRSELERLVHRAEAATEVLRGLLITGCRWGKPRHHPLWIGALARIGNLSLASLSTDAVRKLHSYPALLLQYAAGIAALAGNHYDVLKAILVDTRVRYSATEEEPLIRHINLRTTLDDALAPLFATLTSAAGSLSSHQSPLSAYLRLVLREPLRSLLPDDVHYHECFDRFEYFLCLVYVDTLEGVSPYAVPIGSFSARNPVRWPSYIGQRIQEEAAEAGADWPPIRAGLFGGSVERYEKARAVVDDRARSFD